MPKPLDEWLWKALREWQMPGVAQLRDGVWHRGLPDEYAECGAWVGSVFVRTSAGKDAPYRNPWTNRALRDGQLCTSCFAAELPLVMAVWESLFGPPKGRSRDS